MLTAWRLVHKRKVDEAFTDTGSRRYGGRWNYKGIGVVYVSDSLALAAFEIIVHAASYQALRDYVSIKVIFPKALVVDVNDIARLPKDWQADSPPIKLKETGKIWYFDQISAVLKVPSTIIPTECNYVLNPGHPGFKKVAVKPVVKMKQKYGFIANPGFKKVAVKQAMPFKFDQRLNR
ncbi:MAG: RES family NAD+ phosphorylase [Deltaproteobacteria bacterium]|jgi:RES domain-containing protein|nr:RES family NAD+ phosphorylase [Deltaproteobacteria bacterium]